MIDWTAGLHDGGEAVRERDSGGVGGVVGVGGMLVTLCP